MSIAPGSRFGSLEIVDWIGAGGMGEVYRARDTRLQRDVAIKLLSGAFASDPGRRARFEREAQTLAALNHPHIAQIHGVVDLPAEAGSHHVAADVDLPAGSGSHQLAGHVALVMELVEGEDLTQRLSRERIPLREALQIARQVATALEAAHARGVIHRDLKPANVRLTRSGQVKVLDFGLAKSDVARTGDGSDPTLTSSITIPGTILGTAAYMSPEQARGREVDTRTDIWALGCVLFEVLTGRRAFGGATISDTLAAVLERDPDWSLLPSGTPPRVTRLVRRCLEKDPERRLHAAADVRIEIDDLLSGADEGEPLGTSRSRERWLWLAASLALLATIGALLVNQRRPSDSGGTAVYTASIVLPDGLHMDTMNSAGRFAVSPDGKLLVVAAADASGKSMLWVRSLDSSAMQPLRGSEGASFPLWSPDSRSIAFLAQNKLKRIDAAGGDVVTLCDTRFTTGGATWGRDGTILFTPQGGAPLSRVSAAGGAAPVPVTVLDASKGEVQHSHPFFLPDGRHFLYMVIGNKTGGMTDPSGIFVGSLDSKEPGRFLSPGSNPKFGNGHLVFVRGGTLLAQPFDPDRLTLSGQPAPLVDQVQVSFGGTTGVAGSFSVSQAGVLAYQTATVARSRLTWFDRSGTVLGTLAEPDDYDDVALSPDGTRVAVSVLDPPRASRDVWAIDVTRGVRERLTFDPGDDFAPNWAKDGSGRIVFSSRRASGVNLYDKAGGGSESLLFADPIGKFNPDMSPDGRAVVYVAGGGIINRSEIWMLPLVGDKKPVPLVATPFIQTHPRISPDGHWLSYTSNDSGEREVYVASFPVPGSRVRVSAAGGGWARWSPTGKEIFYLAPNNDMVAVPFTTQGGAIQIGPPARLFAATPRAGTRLDAFPYDVAPDGRRFLVNTLADVPGPDILTLVINWHARSPR